MVWSLLCESARECDYVSTGKVSVLSMHGSLCRGDYADEYEHGNR